MKPLSFRQDVAVQKYLFILQEYTNTQDPEMLEPLKEASYEVSQFLSPDEMEELDSMIQTEPVEPVVEELPACFVLPAGWKAEDFTISITDQVTNLNKQYVEVQCVIHRKEYNGGE